MGGDGRKMVLVSAVAMVDEDLRLLLAQRPEGKALAGLWEFPGGKVEPGESPEAALVRELREELDVETHESDFRPFSFASHAYESFHLLMPVYLCRRWRGQVRGMEGQATAWVRAEELSGYPTPPADVALMAAYREWVAAQG